MPTPGQQWGKILVIDQDKAMTFFIKVWLQSRGFGVSTLSTDLAEWRQHVRQGFEVILCDDSLPQLPPEELLQFWQSLNQDGFIIFMGANPAPERVLELILSGAFTYLMKPLSEEKLLQALSQGQRNRQTLLDILSISEQLHQANRKLQQQHQRLQTERQRLQEQKVELSFINSFSYALTSTLEPVKLATIIATRLREVVNFSFLGLDCRHRPESRKIFLSSPLSLEGREIFLQQLQRWIPDSSPAPENPASFQVFPCCWESGPYSGIPRYQQWFPLEMAGQPVGLLVLAGERPLALPLSRLRLLRALGPYIALAMKNALDHEHLESLAKYDPLTQIMNRRMFDYYLQREAAASQRYDYPLSLILMDIDRFKQINDRYGHLAGDEVLKQVAGVLKNELRECDVLARYGGDEFALILPHTSLKGARKLARRLRRSLGRENFANGLGVKVTVSMGIVDNQHLDPPTLQALLFQADRALHQAKLQGRNAICSAAVLPAARVPLGSPEPPRPEPPNSPL